MQFEKQLSGGRSTFALARWRNKASRDSSHLMTEISALPAWSEEDAPRSATVAAGAWLVVKAAARFAARANVAFPNFLLTVVSWIFAQALAGFAACGEAMYPGLVGAGEPVDHRDPMRGTRSQHENPYQLQSRRFGLSKISPIANNGIEDADSFGYRGRPSPAQLILLRPNTPRDLRERAAAAARRSTSSAAFIARFRPRIRRGQDGRLAIAELRAFDNRRLRDIGISRYYIEYPAGRGDRRE